MGQRNATREEQVSIRITKRNTNLFRSEG